MQTVIHSPSLRIWIQGRPQSFQKKGSLTKYTERIKEAASAAVSVPTKSHRIDIEIWFCAKHVDRADVDNIVKPVLDSLIGIVVIDDRQVRSIRAVAVPPDDIVGFGASEPGILERLLNGEEFLVNVFSGHRLPGFGP